MDFKEWLVQTEGWKDWFKTKEPQAPLTPDEVEDDRLGYVRGTTEKRKKEADIDNNKDAETELMLGLEPGTLAKRRAPRVSGLGQQADIKADFGLSDEEESQRQQVKNWKNNQTDRGLTGATGEVQGPGIDYTDPLYNKDWKKALAAKQRERT